MLRVGLIVGWLLSMAAGAVIASCALLPFNLDAEILYLSAAIIGAALGGLIYVRTKVDSP